MDETTCQLSFDDLEVLYLRDALREYARAVGRQAERLPPGTFSRDSLEAKQIRLNEMVRRVERVCLEP